MDTWQVINCSCLVLRCLVNALCCGCCIAFALPEAAVVADSQHAAAQFCAVKSASRGAERRAYSLPPPPLREHVAPLRTLCGATRRYMFVARLLRITESIICSAAIDVVAP